jgi:hypothetical protein
MAPRKDSQNKNKKGKERAQKIKCRWWVAARKHARVPTRGTPVGTRGTVISRKQLRILVARSGTKKASDHALA